METTLVAPRALGRTPLSALNKLTIAALIVLALALVYVQAVLIGMIIPPLAVFAVLALVAAGAIRIGWRWAPLLAVLIAGVLLALDSEPMIASIMNPTLSLPQFVAGVIMLPTLAVAIVAGIAATVQNYRHAADARRTPRGLAYGLTALVAVILGAILVAAMPISGTTVDISPEALSELPALTTKQFTFDQTELRVKAGETVAIQLANGDTEAHFLDIDELNVHAPIPAGKSSLAVFKPMAPGTYTFYCHPHADKASKQGMVGTLIVE